ncbi:MAG TPA: SPOR domain-containing protein [Solimonas sp.]
MNEVVKRRLAGAIVLIGVAFVGVSLLPRINSAPGEEGVRIVVINLGAPETETPAPSSTGVPPNLAVAGEEGPYGTMPTEASKAGPASESDEDAMEDPGAPSTPTPAPAPVSPAATAVAKPAPPKPVPAATAATETKPLASMELPSPASAPEAVPAPSSRNGLKMAETLKPPPAAAAAAPSTAPAAAPPASGSASVVPPSPRASAPTAAVVPATKPSAPAGASRWYVQVGGFSDVRNAHQVQQRLQGVGQASIISPSESERGTLYRVRAGPYASREAAVAAQSTIAGAGFPGSALIEP